MRARGAGQNHVVVVSAAGLAVAFSLAFTLALSGCTATAGPAPTPLSAPVSAAPKDPGADVGDARPIVTWDGPMVRRRVVVGIRAQPDANLESLRAAFVDEAGRSRLDLSDVSPNVLEPSQLAQWVPNLTLVLPEAASVHDATDFIASSREDFPDIAEYTVKSVLVHDLQFSVAVPAAEAAVIGAEIDAEGIVTDALGRYDLANDGAALRIHYTGPLLSDALVEQVRAGIARPAETEAAAVTVEPGTVGGSGVDMATEPVVVAVTAVAAAEGGTTHGHDTALAGSETASAGPKTASAGLGWIPFGVVALAVALVTLVWVRLDRRGRAQTPSSDTTSLETEPQHEPLSELESAQASRSTTGQAEGAL